MHVWSSCRLGGLTLPSRFVHTAVGEGFATNTGQATPRLRDRYALLGRGGHLGLIITGHVFVEPAGRMREGQAGLYDDAMISGFAEVAKAARRDGSKLCMQIAHGGIMTMPDLTGQSAVGPSAMAIREGETTRTMTIEAIHNWVRLFAATARRARDAGFDAVQLHAAHSYGLSQFLSPYFNKRDDEYGGSVANRTRIVLEIIRAIRDVCGQDFPVLIKVNGEDGLEGGLTLEDAVASLALCEEAGLAGAEISGGSCILSSKEDSPFRTVNPKTLKNACYFRTQAKACKQALGIPIIMVGGIRRLEAAEDILAAGEADLVGICRPLIREPDLLARWHNGQADHPTCISCNKCVDICRTVVGVHCPLKL